MSDPVAQRRSADLQDTLDEIEAALARIEAGTYGCAVPADPPSPWSGCEMRPFAEACVTCASSR